MDAHRDFNRGKRDKQVVTSAELSKTIGEKAKVEEELSLVQGQLDAEMRKNVKLLSSMDKLAEEKRGLDAKLVIAASELNEAKQNIEAFAFELRTCYDDTVNDYVSSAEFQEKLTAQRVEGYFDLIEKVGEKYPSLDWSFLNNEEEKVAVEQGKFVGTKADMAPGTEVVIQESELLVQGGNMTTEPASDPTLPMEGPSQGAVVNIPDKVGEARDA